ncbi:interferon-related developmental regulator 1 [Olea europaea subsp. europaea]|uniref:Interferon-related developmental regulator 1 n=1 Tax=Olea europaea subsp. europaea TaxID=158383 RepID=A0A8S0V2X2_OLEEU|nr:interferon-related developmental regulator 1 [Olea europaea subsp. europaea]
MNQLLDDLFAKRGSTREKALSLITEDFTINYRHQFSQKNFATLLYRFLYSLKKGSAKEIALASHALGLLAVTIGCGDNAHELYKESLPLISKALKSRTESMLLSIIDCLAVATFVGGSDFEETETSMQILWQFIHLVRSDNVAAKKHSSAALSAAISAWSLLLTTVDGWNINYKYWKGAISVFLDVLQVDDPSVRIAAGEALALICEVGFLEKFVFDTNSADIGTNEKENDLLKQYSSMKELQEKISSHVRSHFQQTAKSSVCNSLNEQHKFSLNLLNVLEDGCFRETALKIGKQSLKLNSWSQLLQANFLKQFLRRGFVKHMLENEFLHDVFNFTSRKQTSGNELYVSEREEVTLKIFVPENRTRDDEDFPQKTQRAPTSAFRKAKTQLLNKQRVAKDKELWPTDD